MNLSWRKSSYSSETANCVEVSRTADAVYVRDSKAGNDSAVLEFEPDAWRFFLKGMRADG